jgi:hypothetical protein
MEGLGAGVGAMPTGFGGAGGATCGADTEGTEGAGVVALGLGMTGMLKGLGVCGAPASPGAGGMTGLGGVGMVGGVPAIVGSGFGGRLIMAASRGLAAPGFPSRRGGKTMRTVSFLGSFMVGFYCVCQADMKVLHCQRGTELTAV